MANDIIPNRRKRDARTVLAWQLEPGDKIANVGEVIARTQIGVMICVTVQGPRVQLGVARLGRNGSTLSGRQGANLPRRYTGFLAAAREAFRRTGVLNA